MKVCNHHYIHNYSHSRPSQKYNFHFRHNFSGHILTLAGRIRTRRALPQYFPNRLEGFGIREGEIRRIRYRATLLYKIMECLWNGTNRPIRQRRDKMQRLLLHSHIHDHEPTKNRLWLGFSFFRPFFCFFTPFFFSKKVF